MLRREPLRSPWFTVEVVLGGNLLVALNVTAVNVALPAMGADLGAQANLDWIVTGYLFALALGAPAAGWLADRYGQVPVFAASLIVFGAGSLLIAVAQDLPTAVAFRIVQGLGGAAAMPLGMALVYTAFPPERRGTGLGVWGMAVMVGPALGPLVGGWLVEAASWRLLFVGNVPLALAAAAAALWLLSDRSPRDRRPLDWIGLALVGSGLGGLLLAFTNARTRPWTDPAIIVPFAVAVPAMGAFVLRGLRSRNPVLDLRIFAMPGYSLSLAIGALISMAQYATIVLPPIQLQLVNGESALGAGLLLWPAGLATGLFMAIGGPLGDRVGPRLPVALGTTVMCIAVWQLATQPEGMAPVTIMWLLVLHGAGLGLANMTNNAAAMHAVPPALLSQASVLRFVNRHLSGVVSTAVLATLITHRIGGLAPTGVAPAPALGAYRFAFGVVFVVLAVTPVLALWLPGRRRHQSIQERLRRQEAADPG